MVVVERAKVPYHAHRRFDLLNVTATHEFQPSCHRQKGLDKQPAPLEKGKKMEELKNEAMDAQQLHDEELAEVAGGSSLSARDRIYCTSLSYCGYYSSFTMDITYYPCSKCRTPMYTQEWNPKWICDCCGNSEFFPVAEIWPYSREQLISDAIS